MLNLDTNVLLAIGEGLLRRDEARLVEDDQDWAISDIVLWAIAMLRQDQRIKIGLEDSVIVDLIARLRVLPITSEIARMSQRLDFESDPADELIAATSIVHRAPLVTRDSRILASKIVPLALN